MLKSDNMMTIVKAMMLSFEFESEQPIFLVVRAACMVLKGAPAFRAPMCAPL